MLPNPDYRFYSMNVQRVAESLGVLSRTQTASACAADLKTLDADPWHPDDKLLVWLCGCGYFRPCDASGNQAALDGEPLLGL
jgi:hypothetical protein